MSHETLSPETITRLWSEAIVQAAVEQRSEPHVFAELVLAAAGRAAAEGWRPIETAPKDGSAILTPEGITWWHKESWMSGRWECCGNGDAFTFMGPTHWMPLPAPPAPPSQETT